MIELDHAVLFRGVDRVSENGCALAAGGSPCKLIGKSMAVKNVVAEHQCDTIRPDKIGADDEGIGQAARLVLRHIAKAQSEVARIDAKLSNEQFVAKAPEEVLNEQREKRAEAAALALRLRDAIARSAD